MKAAEIQGRATIRAPRKVGKPHLKQRISFGFVGGFLVFGISSARQSQNPHYDARKTILVLFSLGSAFLVYYYKSPYKTL